MKNTLIIFTIYPHVFGADCDEQSSKNEVCARPAWLVRVGHSTSHHALDCTACHFNQLLHVTVMVILILIATRLHMYPVGSEAPTGIAGVTATFTIPLTVVAASSSTYFPVFHYMGEKQAIRLYTTDVMYSFNGCMQKQAAAGYTLLDRYKLS